MQPRTSAIENHSSPTSRSNPIELPAASAVHPTAQAIAFDNGLCIVSSVLYGLRTRLARPFQAGHNPKTRDALGGIRTRTGLPPEDFTYHYRFRGLPYNTCKAVRGLDCLFAMPRVPKAVRFDKFAFAQTS